MLATLAADPVASLVDTAFVGHLGAAQLAGVGMALSIFNAVTKAFNASLLAVTTSEVARAAAAAKAAAALAPAGGSGDDVDEWQLATAERSAGGAGCQEAAPGDRPRHSPDVAGHRQKQPSQQLEWQQQCKRIDQDATFILVKAPPAAGPDRVGAGAGAAGGPPAGPAGLWRGHGSEGSFGASCSSSPPDVLVLLEEGGAPLPTPDGGDGSAADLQGEDGAGAAERRFGAAPELKGGALVAAGGKRPVPPLPAMLLQQQQQQQDGAKELVVDDVVGSSVKLSASRDVLIGAAASSAVVLALAFGVIEAVTLVLFAPNAADAWGAPAGSPLRAPALDFLTVRGATAPITVLLLVLQGILRGLYDTASPLYATVACNAINVALEPPFIFSPLHLGVRGSALATAIAQAVPLVALLVALRRLHGLRLGLHAVDWERLGCVFKPTGFLVLRSVCVSAVFAVATALASRAGPTAAAAHQVALQVWLSSSLLADALAVAVQTLVASEVAAGNLRYARGVVRATLLLGAGLGTALGAALGLGAGSLPLLFTQDAEVLQLLRPLMWIVAATQPVNALAFVLDGVLYGAGGFRYASAMMLPCAAISLGVMLGGCHWAAARQLPAALEQSQLIWIWAGLVALMALRSVAISAPLLLRQYPLACLYQDKRAAKAAAAAAGLPLAGVAGAAPWRWAWPLPWRRHCGSRRQGGSDGRALVRDGVRQSSRGAPSTEIDPFGDLETPLLRGERPPHGRRGSSGGSSSGAHDADDDSCCSSGDGALDGGGCGGRSRAGGDGGCWWIPSEDLSGAPVSGRTGVQDEQQQQQQQQDGAALQCGSAATAPGLPQPPGSRRGPSWTWVPGLLRLGSFFARNPSVT